MPHIAVIVGSKTDEPLIMPGLELLDQFKISYEYVVMSAHRNPDKVREYVTRAKDQGIELFIAAAGAAAHLPGVIASWTTLPVIGIPLPTSDLKGIDSLYSIVQMPGGVPVACVGIGTAGVKNAALLAAQILGIKYQDIKKSYEEYKQNLAKG